MRCLSYYYFKQDRGSCSVRMISGLKIKLIDSIKRNKIKSSPCG